MTTVKFQKNVTNIPATRMKRGWREGDFTLRTLWEEASTRSDDRYQLISTSKGAFTRNNSIYHPKTEVQCNRDERQTCTHAHISIVIFVVLLCFVM